jgi:hypothetical protein
MIENDTLQTFLIIKGIPGLLILLLYIHYSPKLIGYYFQQSKHKRILQVILGLPFGINILLLLIIDVGIFNEFLNLFLVINMLYLAFLYVYYYHFNESKDEKRRLKVIILAIALWFCIIGSSMAFTGVNAPLNASDHYLNWKSQKIELDNLTLNLKMDTEVKTVKGFFVDTPIQLSVYNGRLQVSKGKLPEGDILVQMKLEPLPNGYNSGDILWNFSFKPDKNNESIFYLKDNNYVWFLSYIYSGEKKVLPTLYINNSKLAVGTSKEIVEIEKGYVKVQTEGPRFTIILTIWIIFIAFYQIVNQGYDSFYDSFSKSEIVKKFKKKGKK